MLITIPIPRRKRCYSSVICPCVASDDRAMSVTPLPAIVKGQSIDKSVTHVGKKRYIRKPDDTLECFLYASGVPRSIRGPFAQHPKNEGLFQAVVASLSTPQEGSTPVLITAKSL